MSLTHDDLQQIRLIIREEITDRVEPLENDIKEIYFMLRDLMKAHDEINKPFSKRSLEKQLLHINKELIQAAKQAGVSLPRP